MVEIDQLNLEEECIRLPSDYLKYAHLSADARQVLDENKAALDLAESEVKDFIRSNPKKFGAADKLSEKAIDSLVQRQDRYQKAQVELQKAKHEADLYQAVVWALEHKKRSLTLLVELKQMSWNASVRPGSEPITTPKAARPFRRDKQDVLPTSVGMVR